MSDEIVRSDRSMAFASFAEEEFNPPSKIFNTAKTDYGQHPSVFLGQDPGLFDTVNRKFPLIWDNWKEMKSLDWSEDEFGFAACNATFKRLDRAIVDRMIKTLAWQWEGDTIAARTIVAVMSNFITCSELQAAWGRIGDNENLHAATYSEIVRLSFDNPQEVLDEVLRVKEAMQRLSGVSRVMNDAFIRSHQYALGMVPNDQETYNHAMMFTTALLLLERIQFMASFAVTFAIGEIPEAGGFMPICKAVQKICQDELEIHVGLDKLIIAGELKTERGRIFLEQKGQDVRDLIKEVVNSEVSWVHWLLVEDDRPLPGLPPADAIEWIYFSAADVYRQFGMESEFPVPESPNVARWIGRWLNIAKTQSSPQEQDNNQYKTNVMVRDDAGVVFPVDF